MLENRKFQFRIFSKENCKFDCKFVRRIIKVKIASYGIYILYNKSKCFFSYYEIKDLISVIILTDRMFFFARRWSRSHTLRSRHNPPMRLPSRLEKGSVPEEYLSGLFAGRIERRREYQAWIKMIDVGLIWIFTCSRNRSITP